MLGSLQFRIAFVRNGGWIGAIRQQLTHHRLDKRLVDKSSVTVSVACFLVGSVCDQRLDGVG